MRTVGILKNGKVVNLTQATEKPKRPARKTQPKEAEKPEAEKPEADEAAEE